MRYLVKIESVPVTEIPEFDEANDKIAKERWRGVLSARVTGLKIGTVAVLFRIDHVAKTMTFVEAAQVAEGGYFTPSNN